MLIKNNTKKRWIILVTIVLLSYLVGIIFRFTWKDPSPKEVFDIFPLLSTSNDKDGIFIVEQEDNKENIDTSILSLSDLETQADVITTGTVEEISKVTRYACYFKVKINEKYKGHVTSKYFTYVVPITIINSAYNGNLMRINLNSGLLPLRVGENYLFLLEKIKFDSRTNIPNELKNSYYPIFKNPLGVYNLNIDESIPMKTGEVYLADVPKNVVNSIVDFENLEIYNKFFKEVKDKYKDHK